MKPSDITEDMIERAAPYLRMNVKGYARGRHGPFEEICDPHPDQIRKALTAALCEPEIEVTESDVAAMQAVFDEHADEMIQSDSMFAEGQLKSVIKCLVAAALPKMIRAMEKKRREEEGTTIIERVRERVEKVTKIVTTCPHCLQDHIVLHSEPYTDK